MSFMPAPLEVLRAGVLSYAPYLDDASGELLDPVFGVPTQYSTPYHALGRAVLAAHGAETEKAPALAALDAALRHVEDLGQPATTATFHRITGTTGTTNHRDFFWPAILRARLLLDAAALDARIAAVDPLASFATRPPSNWSAVWLSGEWLRMRLGLAPTTPETFDRWLAAFFERRVLLKQGFYQEPGHPNSYDLFTRLHLAAILRAGYQGAWRGELARLMETGLQRSLAVQLSDGSLASSHRSTGQSWTDGAQCAYFTMAGARPAAALALSSLARWQRPEGPFSPVQNLLPPAWRVGYEGYTADGHYGNLALGFLAHAISEGLTEDPVPEPRPARTFIEGDPTYRALVHAGPYSAHVNALPAPAYDGFGLVDVTFGPGRYLQFASSVRHLSEPTNFYNLGIGLRSGPGRSAIRPIAQQALTLIGQIEPGTTPASLRLRARVRGESWVYEMGLRADAEGVHVEEGTPGDGGWKTLLVPYLLDAGTGHRTQVDVRQGSDSVTVVTLTLDAERVQITLRAPCSHVLDLPHGYENRRGLCGLLRLDLAERTESLRYSLSRI